MSPLPVYDLLHFPSSQILVLQDQAASLINGYLTDNHMAQVFNKAGYQSLASCGGMLAF